MTRLTLVIALTLAVLLLCGSPSQIQAQSDTKIVIRDGGSILLRADGLDAGGTWSFSRDELKHRNANGVLSGLQIVDAGTDRCAGSPTCGVDPTQHWTIQLTYDGGSVTIESISAHKGLHLTHVALPFDQWQPTGNADEREIHRGDGLRIASVKVNGGKNLCPGNGCVINLQYSPR